MCAQEAAWVRAECYGGQEPIRFDARFVFTVFLALGLLLLAVSSPLLGDVSQAYQHIDHVMGQYHQSFDVCTELSAAGNHFVMFGRLTSAGDDQRVVVDPGCDVLPHSGATCIENVFLAAGDNWGSSLMRG